MNTLRQAGMAVGIALLGALLSGRAIVVLGDRLERSEEHTSELQSLMRISYAVFCLKKKNKQHQRALMCQLTPLHDATLTQSTILVRSPQAMYITCDTLT